METQSMELKMLYVGERCTSPYEALIGSWRRVGELLAGEVARFRETREQPDGRSFAFYRIADARMFVRAASVSEHQRQNWRQESKRLGDFFEQSSHYLLQIDERVSADHLICRVLVSGSRGAPDVCIGKDSAWDYLTNFQSYTLVDGQDRNRKSFLSLDGVGLWEIIEAWSPLAEGEPVRIEMVRHRALTAQGFGNVFEMSKPDFIQDADRRREIMAEVERIEHGLATADHWNCVLSCGKLAERILTELGKQRLRGGKTFGNITTEEQLFKQTYKPMQDGFVAEFTKLAPDEMKWLPGALDMLKSWADENRHAGKNERQLLDADQHTAHACYGVLRDFVRLLMHLHGKMPVEIAPKASVGSTP